MNNIDEMNNFLSDSFEMIGTEEKDEILGISLPISHLEIKNSF